MHESNTQEKDTKSKLRIVIGINDFIIGGGQRLIVDLLKYADHETFEYSLITLKQHKDTEDFYDLVPEEVKVYKIDFKNSLDLRAWKELYGTLSHVRPHVVWSHMFFGNTVFRILKLLFGYHVVANEHNTYTKKTFAQKTADKILSYLTHRIVAVSETVATFTSAQESIAKDKFIVIPNGVDVEAIQEEVTKIDPVAVKESIGVPHDAHLIINTARLMKQKNQELLLRAFALFHRDHPQHILLIVGGGPLEAKLKTLAHELGISEAVKFLGVRRDVPALLAASNIFVLSSDVEGFGIVGIEAMACGLSVVSTRTAGPDVYIKDGENGYLVDSTPEDVARKIALIADADERIQQKLKEGARATASEYDIKKVTKLYEDLFLESLNK